MSPKGTPSDHFAQAQSDLDAAFNDAALNETDARAWTVVYGDLDPEAVLAWLDASIGLTVGKVEDASRAWAELRLRRVRGEGLLN